jgi:hypothetical protein
MEQKGNDFRALQVLHGAMLAGMALLAAIATWLVISCGPLGQTDASFGKTLQVVVVLAAIGATAAGFRLFKKRIQAIEPLDTVKNKLTAYRAAAIMRWALIEFPTLLSLIAFLLTGNYAFLALGIALMLLFAVLRPAKLMIVYLLKLTEKEVSELEGGASE